MQSDISKACADFLREKYTVQGNEKLKATHARELTAAFFGYKSHAALLAEKSYPLDDLEKSRILIPALQLMEHRRKKLDGLPANLPDTEDLAEQLVEFLKDEKYFTGEAWLTDSLEEYVTAVFLPEKEYFLSNELSGVMAETNAIFDETLYDETDISEGSDGIHIEVYGEFNGTSDPDRVFSGDKINMNVTIDLSRVAGRTAYRKPELSVSGEVDDYSDPEDRFTPPPGRPKDQFIAMTGGFRFGETPDQFGERQKKILAIRKKISAGKADVNDINALSELLGTDRDDFGMQEEDL